MHEMHMACNFVLPLENYSNGTNRRKHKFMRNMANIYCSLELLSSWFSSEPHALSEVPVGTKRDALRIQNAYCNGPEPAKIIMH